MRCSVRCIAPAHVRAAAMHNALTRSRVRSACAAVNRTPRRHASPLRSFPQSQPRGDAGTHHLADKDHAEEEGGGADDNVGCEAHGGGRMPDVNEK